MFVLCPSSRKKAGTERSRWRLQVGGGGVLISCLPQSNVSGERDSIVLCNLCAGYSAWQGIKIRFIGENSQTILITNLKIAPPKLGISRLENLHRKYIIVFSFSPIPATPVLRFLMESNFGILNPGIGVDTIYPMQPSFAHGTGEVRYVTYFASLGRILCP